MQLSQGFNMFGVCKVLDGERAACEERNLHVGSLNSSSSGDIVRFALCCMTINFSWQLAEAWKDGLHLSRRLTEMNVLLQNILSWCFFFFFWEEAARNFRAAVDAACV